MTSYETKDSGARQHFESGMQRDTESGKARFDLMLPEGVPYEEQLLTRFAMLLSRGAEKYDARNWEKATGAEEVARARSSAFRHFMQWLTGETDEDHAAAVIFNLMVVETVKAKPNLVQSAEDAPFDRGGFLSDLLAHQPDIGGGAAPLLSSEPHPPQVREVTTAEIRERIFAAFNESLKGVEIEKISRALNVPEEQVKAWRAEGKEVPTAQQSDTDAQEFDTDMLEPELVHEEPRPRYDINFMPGVIPTADAINSAMQQYHNRAQRLGS